MASIIRIKRSQVSGNPSTLAAGELAYSALADNGSNGGDRLYIGIGTETNGNAANHFVVGGKFFTDRLDHTAGVLTASSALVVDSDSKLDQLKVDNLDLNGNTLSSTNINGNINITPNGVGAIILSGQSFPTSPGTDGSFLKTDNSGVLVWSAVPSGSFTITGDTGTDVFTTGETLTFTGTDPVATAVTDNNVTISVKDASTSAKGVASFSSSSFDVTSGDVTIKTGGVSNDQLANSSITLGTSGVSWGGTITTLAGLTQLDVDNVRVDGNTISTTDTDGDLILSPNGTGKVSIANAYTLPRVDGNSGQILVTDGSGSVSFQSPAPSSFTLAGNSGTDTFNTGETLTFSGTAPINTVVSDNTVTISAADATINSKGVASFSSSSFDVSGGEVTIKAGGVSNNQLANSSFTLGSTTVSLGGTQTSIAGITEFTVDNLNFNGNSISSTDTNGDISLDPNGTGTVAVNGARISGVGTPTQTSDAATKEYVDQVAQGIKVAPAVRVLTDFNLDATYDNGTAGVGATLTADDNGVFPTVDGISAWSVGNGILVKGQTNAAHNGRYVLTTIGNASTPWVLTRCGKCDEATEIPSSYVFVQEGGVYADTGWVATVANLDTFTVGTDAIVWTQFSGAGTFTAGNGLSLTGTAFEVNVATNGGIEIVADSLQLKSSVAGNGLTYTNGVVAVGGTADRITVGQDSVDIASTYVGQTSITTLGTVTTGTWSANTIGTTHGGTGLTSYATGDLLYASATNTLAKLTAGGVGQVLQVNASGVPVWGDIDGGTY
jgi:hypothetical protein